MKLPAVIAAAALALIGAVQPAPAQQPAAGRAPAPCDANGSVKFVCGLKDPEDLILIPRTDWIIGSQWIMNPAQAPGGLYLIDRKTHAATILPLPAGKPRKPFTDCAGPPNPAMLSTHGLNISANGRGKFIVYAVDHGGHEGIQVFDVTVPRAGPPAFAWAGCITSPGSTVLNAVAPISRGRLIATEFYKPPLSLQDAQRGTMTGAVWMWTPGKGFEKLPGTELAGGNGVEVTPDGKYVFAAEWGVSKIRRYGIADSAKDPWTMALPFRIDNVRWAPDGNLLMAGPGAAANCAPGARCPMLPMVAELDPKTLTMTMVKQGPAEPTMGAISTALVVGDELWTGSYGGDRVAYQPLPK